MPNLKADSRRRRQLAGLRLPAQTCAGAPHADCGCLEPTEAVSKRACDLWRWEKMTRKSHIASTPVGERALLAARWWSSVANSSSDLPAFRVLTQPRPVAAVELLGKLSIKVKKTRLCGFAQVGLSIVLETRSIDSLEAEALALHAQLKKLSLFSSRGLV